MVAALAVSGQCCQCIQRLLKTLHRDDSQPVRVLSGVGRVLSGRNEKGIHMCFARADRFLLDAPDRADGAVQEDLSLS